MIGLACVSQCRTLIQQRTDDNLVITLCLTNLYIDYTGRDGQDLTTERWTERQTKPPYPYMYLIYSIPTSLVYYITWNGKVVVSYCYLPYANYYYTTDSYLNDRPLDPDAVLTH